MLHKLRILIKRAFVIKVPRNEFQIHVIGAKSITGQVLLFAVLLGHNIRMYLMKKQNVIIQVERIKLGP